MDAFHNAKLHANRTLSPKMHNLDSIHNMNTIHLGEGRLEVICGPMFSGKTEELLRRVRRAVIAHQPTLLIKPATDTRYAVNEIVSHDKNKIKCKNSILNLKL